MKTTTTHIAARCPVSRIIAICILMAVCLPRLEATQPENTGATTLLQLGTQQITVAQFEKSLALHRKLSPISASEYMALYIPYRLKILAARRAGLDATIAATAEWKLLKTNTPELADEQMDDLLCYAITDTAVWTRAARDTAGLRAFYLKNAQRYRWEKRIDATIYYCADDSVAARMQAALRLKNKQNTPLPRPLFTAFCSPAGISPCIDTVRSVLPKRTGTVADRVKWRTGITKTVAVNGKIAFLDIHAVLRPGQKTCAEARGQVIAAYRDELMMRWVGQLRATYPVTINADAWRQLKKKYNE